VGVGLIAVWYFEFGSMTDKYQYNPLHPYVFVLAMIGWLMIRNSSKYLTECHSTFLEFLGRNTLETYVLQFHLFMNHKVQNIPIVIPGSGPTGNIVIKTLNMLLCGIIFVSVAILARKVTVSTQNTVVDLVTIIKKKVVGGEEENDSYNDEREQEMKPMVSNVETA
jgi:fucose 4-O-acetylase-like acetyltransferase